MLNSNATTDTAPNAITHGDGLPTRDSSGSTWARIKCSIRVRFSKSVAWPHCRSLTDCSKWVSRSRNSVWSRCTPMTAVAAASVKSSKPPHICPRHHFG